MQSKWLRQNHDAHTCRTISLVFVSLPSFSFGEVHGNVINADIMLYKFVSVCINLNYSGFFLFVSFFFVPLRVCYNNLHHLASIFQTIFFFAPCPMSYD